MPRLLFLFRVSRRRFGGGPCSPLVLFPRCLSTSTGLQHSSTARQTFQEGILHLYAAAQEPVAHHQKEVVTLWNNTLQSFLQSDTDASFEAHRAFDLSTVPSFVMTLCLAASTIEPFSPDRRTYYEIRALCLYTIEECFPMMPKLLQYKEPPTGDTVGRSKGELTITEKGFLLERSEKDKLSNLAPPLDHTSLLFVISLLDACHLVVSTFPLPKKSQSVLLNALEIGVSAVEQLPSTSISALLRSYAQCVDGSNFYTHVASYPDLAPYLERIRSSKGHLSYYLPVKFSERKEESERTEEWGDDLSVLEREETTLSKALRGGTGHDLVLSTKSLTDLHSMSRVIQKRINEALAAYHVRCSTSPTDRPVWRDSRSSVSQAILQQKIKEGQLGLLSLQERKKKEPPTPQKRRKTIGSLSKEKEEERAPSLDNTVTSEMAEITLSDVAECASALAALRFGDNVFWESVARFLSWNMFCFREENTLKDSAAEEEEQYLTEVKDILFAFDYVQKHKLYHSIMKELVQLSFISAPVDPPSHRLKTIKEMKNENSI